jgi:hypothetical protein
MTPQDAIIANFNGELDRAAMQRALLAHPDWRAPWPAGGSAPTMIITDANMTPTAWLLSSEEAYRAACREQGEAAIGPVAPIAHLDEVIAQLDPRIVVLRIDPGSPIALHIQTDELDAFRRLARGVRIERAMAASDFAALRAHDGYYVPYYGVLGQGHQVIALPTERGSMVAAFTAEDAVNRFLATGTEENRVAVKFVRVDGEALFEHAAPQLAQGVIVNIAGPRTFGFDLTICKDIAGAR